jgi:predicted nucleotidyltransferase
MNAELKGALGRFKELLTARVPVQRIVLFGSGARDDFRPGSDVDVIVVLEGAVDDRMLDTVSDCAWEAGFDLGLVIVPIAFSREEWESGPERHSLLARAVANDGVAI